jgi:hypothetical protein
LHHELNTIDKDLRSIELKPYERLVKLEEAKTKYIKDISKGTGQI